MLTSRATLPNHYRPKNIFARSLLSLAGILKFEKFVTMSPTWGLFAGVKCLSLHTCLLDRFDCTISTLHFCILWANLVHLYTQNKCANTNAFSISTSMPTSVPQTIHTTETSLLLSTSLKKIFFFFFYLLSHRSY